MPASKSKKEILGVKEKTLKDYAGFFEKNSLKELSIEEEGIKITMKKGRERAAAQVVTAAPTGPQQQQQSSTQEAAPSEGKPDQKEQALQTKPENLHEVKAPLVGTYYEAPSPESPKYANEGDKVNSDSVVCIVEAMKNMNEIKAGASGKIKEILVKNGEPVKKEQTIMLIEK